MIRGLTILIIGTMLAAGARAQHRQVLLGDSLYQHYSYTKAIRHYEKALRKVDKTWPVHERLANTYYHLQDYNQAMLHFDESSAHRNEWQEETRWNYLQVQRSMGNDQAVREMIGEWADHDQRLAGSLETGMQARDLYFMDSAAYDVSLAFMNSEFSEFAPAYYRKGLVFASSRREGNTSTKKYHWDGEYYLDLYYTTGQPGPSGEVEITPMTANTTYHDGPLVFFDNDRRVIFTRNEAGRSRDGLRTLVLMQADVTPEGRWENIAPLPFNNESWSMSHPALSPDGRTLYFVSDKPGGYGGTDIWMSHRTGDTWSEPENLGADINTPGDEMFPYTWGRQLMFASDGHPGLGGLDIFYAEVFAEKAWMVRNAGFPVNTQRDDFGMITLNGREGYFASNRAGQDDIYTFIRDKMLVDIFYEERDGTPLDSVASVVDGRSIQPVADRTHLLLPLNSVTDVRASRDGYADTVFQVTTDDSFYLARTIPMTALAALDRGLMEVYPIASEYQVDFYLATPEQLLHADSGSHWIETLNLADTEPMPGPVQLDRIRRVLGQNGYDVVVKDTISAIFYDFDKHAIRSSEKANLGRLIELLDRYPNAKIIVSAHADARGSHAYNDKLAKRRANAARDYLIAQGIGSERIEARSFGERQLWIECEQCTEDQHQLNRRATFGVNKKE